MKPPKGPVRQMMGGASEFYGIWKFAKNKEAALEFLKYYTDNWPEAFKASEGTTIRALPISYPSRCRSCRTIRRRRRATSWRSCRIQNEWSAIPGYPGPASPAIDEIYNNFTIPDMLAKTATGAMSAEDSVKWATQQCEAVFKKWAAA